MKNYQINALESSYCNDYLTDFYKECHIFIRYFTLIYFVKIQKFIQGIALKSPSIVLFIKTNVVSIMPSKNTDLYFNIFHLL